MRFSFFAAASLMGAALVVATSPAVYAQETVVLQFPHEAPETTIKGRTVDMFAELVEEYSGGSVQVEVFPGGQLMPSPEETRAAIRGQVDIVAPQTSYFSSLDEIFDVYYQPLLFESFADAMEFVDGELGRSLLQRLETFGLVSLSTWHDGPGYLFVQGEPVGDIADMAGKKIRVFPSKPLEMGVRAASAVPVSMPAADVFLSLQQGLVSGVITTPTYAAPAGWGEVLDGMTRMMMFMGGYGVVINQDSWDSLSAEQQEAVTRAMDEATQWNIGAALENLEEAEATLKSQDVVLKDLTTEQFDEWQAAMEPVYEAQSEELQELIEKIRAR